MRAFARHERIYEPPDERKEPFRYWYNNDFYSYLDAAVLARMIFSFNPAKIIEVGSGYSTAVMHDINEFFLERALQVTMIEPYPDRVHALLRPADLSGSRLLQVPVQTVDPVIWMELGANDILFIDSSHVSKVGSDVNHILFNVLPLLKPGVIVHFHDIFYPFEYPLDWVLGGVAWNEAYLLRAFLQNNNSYKIIFFNDYLKRLYPEQLHEALPISIKDTDPDRALHNAPGNSIWLRKQS